MKKRSTCCRAAQRGKREGESFHWRSGEGSFGAAGLKGKLLID